MPACQRIPWVIPRLWPGSTIFIIGGGPSLKGMELNCLRLKRVIGVNQAFRVYPWVDVTYFGDCQFRELAPSINQWPGIKVTSCGRVPELGKGWKGIRRVGRSKNYGIETKKVGFVSWNGNSGASAINIAYWLGASRVVLLGFDMHSDNDRHNFHDFYPTRAKTFDPYKNHMRCWPYIARDAAEVGLEIINATPDSAIKDFPFMKLEKLI